MPEAGARQGLYVFLDVSNLFQMLAETTQFRMNLQRLSRSSRDKVKQSIAKQGEKREPYKALEGLLRLLRLSRAL